jgi:hypothetical protein
MMQQRIVTIEYFHYSRIKRFLLFLLRRKKHKMQEKLTVVSKSVSEEPYYCYYTD